MSSLNEKSSLSNPYSSEVCPTLSRFSLGVNGKAEIVVQDAESYQKLLDKIDRLEKLVNNQKKSTEYTSSSDILDLYGAAADIDFAVDDRGISDEMDDNLTGTFDE